ncbi:hypothetical protein D9M68_810070 [compost metagenome]
MTLAVDDIGPRGLVEAGFHQHPLDAILHLFDIYTGQVQQARQHRIGQLPRQRLIELAAGLARRDDSLANLAEIERCDAAVTLAQLLRMKGFKRGEHATSWHYI